MDLKPGMSSTERRGLTSRLKRKFANVTSKSIHSSFYDGSSTDDYSFMAYVNHLITTGPYDIKVTKWEIDNNGKIVNVTLEETKVD